MDKKRVISERNDQGVKLGDIKGSKTGNYLDKVKELKTHNSKFKMIIKSLRNNFTQDKDNNGVDVDDEAEDYGDQFEEKHSKNMSKKN